MNVVSLGRRPFDNTMIIKKSLSPYYLCNWESPSWVVDDNKLTIWDDKDEDGRWTLGVAVGDH